VRVTRTTPRGVGRLQRQADLFATNLDRYRAGRPLLNDVTDQVLGPPDHGAGERPGGPTLEGSRLDEVGSVLGWSVSHWRPRRMLSSLFLLMKR